MYICNPNSLGLLMTFSQPPPEFTWANMTPYQQHSISEKWYIYHVVENSTESKHKCFRKLAQELGLSFKCVYNKYYQITPHASGL